MKRSPALKKFNSVFSKNFVDIVPHLPCSCLNGKNRHHFFTIILKQVTMANKSSLPPNQDQKKFVQDEETGKGRKHMQRNKNNKGYSEDQPGHPVRTTGSMRPDQESYLSTGAKSPNEDQAGGGNE